MFLLFQVIETPQYGTSLQISYYFQLLSCIFLDPGFHPVTLKLLSFRKLNCFSCLMWGLCVCDSMVLPAVQGFRLICFSIRFLRAIQSPLPAWGCSCMLISQFEQNTNKSLPKYLVFLILQEEVSGLGWWGRQSLGLLLFLVSSQLWEMKFLFLRRCSGVRNSALSHHYF